MNTKTRVRGLLDPRVSATALGFATLVSCAVNPATGERQFTLMTEAQEIQMGREADPDIVRSMGAYPDQGLQAYVEGIGLQLAARSERPDLPWTFRVLDDPLVNAFALPGGYIYVTRGILAYLESEAELAGVLGHEIGHVTARHSVSQISQAQLAGLGLGIGMVLAPELQPYEPIASASLGVLFLKFGRDDERQSDELGVRYMARLGYDPAQLSGVMDMLGRVTRGGEEGGGIPEWLSTHPNPENREEQILQMARVAEVAADPPKVLREAFVTRLDGLVFGENPREGFFQEERFYHPDLQFQMTFPRGWKTANLREAVRATAPQEDALFVLTVSSGDSPRSALGQFLAQDGIQGSGVTEAEVNSLPASSADFRFVSGQDRIDGRVSFVLHDGTLFQLLAYGTPGAWPSYVAAVRTAFASFGRLADPVYLDVEPARLRVISLSKSMRLAEVLAQEGVPERADEVRLLNRLEGDPTLPAGRTLKIPKGGRLPR